MAVWPGTVEKPFQFSAVDRRRASSRAPPRLRLRAQALVASEPKTLRAELCCSEASSLQSAMPTPSSYALVSLPLRAFDTDDALSALRGTITSDNGSVQPFTIPEFKIGTLDALVQQADDLTKLEAACQGVVSRVADSLKNLLDGDEEKVAQHKTVNDS